MTAFGVIRKWWPERDGQIWLRVDLGYWRELHRWPRFGEVFQWHGYLPRLWYFVTCAFWHRHDRLEIPTLSPTWNEWDDKLLHAAMAIFVEYYEVGGPGRWKLEDIDRELADATIDTHARGWFEHARPIALEEDALLHWWMIERPARPDPTQSIFVAEGQTTAAALKSHALEEAQDAEDEAMLIRLMKIRRYLWT